MLVIWAIVHYLWGDETCCYRYRRSQPSGSQEESAQPLPVHEEAQPSTSASRTLVILGANAPTSARTRPSTRIKVPRNHKIHKNICRLSHFIEEPNVGRGFIKELCFSSDGRLICSPFGFGVRLLAFSPNCSELSTCVPKQGPVKLFEVGTNECHGDIVVSTKFSPRHCLLVSGCLTGRIVWHQPIVWCDILQHLSLHLQSSFILVLNVWLLSLMTCIS